MKLERKFTNNDIYFMEVVQDKIIINDNYKGIIILDSELKVIKNLYLFDDIVIDKAFIKNSEIVLYCSENCCFIHFNVDTYVYTIIPLSADFSYISFLSLYEWKDNELILLADGGEVLVQVNMLTYIVKKNYAKNKLISIYHEWNKLRKLKLHKVYPDRQIAIFEKDHIFKVINYKKGTNLMDLNVNIKCKDFHDVEFIENFIVLVNEYETVVSDGVANVHLSPLPKGYRFLRCKFISVSERPFLAVLSCNNSDPSMCKLERYSLETDLFSYKV